MVLLFIESRPSKARVRFDCFWVRRAKSTCCAEISWSPCAFYISCVFCVWFRVDTIDVDLLMTDKIEYKHSVLVYIIICLFYSGISYICVNCDELSE